MSLQQQQDNYYPTLTTITVEESKPADQQHVYVETFLIDAVSPPNKKGWKVSHDDPIDFDRRVLESKNHPLVLFQTRGSRGELVWDHPVAPINSMEAAADPVRANIEFQKKYTIGYARYFKKIRNGLWNATYEIVNERAKKFFLKAKEKGIRLFTSPYIVRPSSEKDRQNIKNWALIHNAIVSTPANPEALAVVKDISLFASMGTPDDVVVEEEECDFCVEQSLTDYETWISSQFSNSYQLTYNMTESASSLGSSSGGIVESPSSTINNSSDPSINITPPPPVQQQTNIVPQAENTITTTQINPPDDKEARIAELQKQLTELNQKYATDQRKNTIEKLFSPIESLFVDQLTGILDEKTYNAEIKKYTNGNYTFDEIKDIVEAKYIKAREAQRQKIKTEKASYNDNSSQVSESASFIPYTQMSTTNNNNVIKSRPFLKVLQQTYAGGNF